MDVGVSIATTVLARSARESWLLRVGGASRDSAGGMVAGEDEETDGDEVADEGVACEWSVEEGVSRTWHEDALGVLVADEVYGEYRVVDDVGHVERDRGRRGGSACGVVRVCRR